MDKNIWRVLIIEDTPERQEGLKNLYRDHAWILVNTASKAIKYLSVYAFDLICLDYDLADEEKGDSIAEFIKHSKNANAAVFIHSMNEPGARDIQAHLPLAVYVPYSKITRDNKTFKRLREELKFSLDVNWGNVFRRRKE